MENRGEKNSVYPLNSYEVHPRTKPTRVFMFIYLCGIIALFYHHLTTLIFHSNNLLPSILLLISDLVLSFMWITSQAFRWRPIRRKVYPENLSKLVKEEDLPALDVFICTADPYKEPPMEVVNTALSVLSFDYPPNKISVYVSDDGGSQMTLFALMQGAKFAKHWLPFCRKHNLSKRCPKVVLKQHDSAHLQLDSQEDFQKMKRLYEEMRRKVDQVMEQGYVDDDIVNEEERQVFHKWRVNEFTRQHHPTVIQVLMESSKDVDISGISLPNLIYLSREKSKHIHHNFKAGALNALIRVSAVMSSAPVVLSLDCDMYCNNHQAPRLALCHLLDPNEGSKTAFVQFPQRYRGIINPTDIYNNEVTRPFIINPEGLDGIGTTNYVGTGPFINLKAFYGGPTQPKVNIFPGFNKDESGLERKTISSKLILEAANKVADCNYEQGTNWGRTLGFRYGSLVEDFFTGYRMQCEGWRSIFCNPKTPAFLGDFPISLNDSLIQVKRWSVGLIEVGFSKYCPFTFGTRNRSLLMGMAYGFYAFWPIWAIPIFIYGLLPQLCLIHDIYFVSQGIHLYLELVCDLWFYVYAYLFSATYIQDLIESYYVYNINFKKWWNEQRMWLIRGATCFIFSFIEFTLNQIGISAPDFSLTSKVIDNEQQKRYDQEIFYFGVESPFFVSLSTFALISLASFSFGMVRVIFMDGKLEEMFVQLFLSGFVLVNSLPIYEAMVLRKDGGRMPTRVTLISVLIASLLCYGAGFSMK
ncbi:hypothetical protein C5167_036918 [Papaver somniferum]|uniref:Glycosyltransferase 2-like domain-containing protein n=2 Tax=Papaver somniferum TaxID=3469 RepID=A0A4Y7I9A3_PAPSO|nr:hypothetical protein C5167_036918 [Papaver somniferum]